MVKVYFCYADDDLSRVQSIADELTMFPIENVAVLDDCNYVIFAFSIESAKSEQVRQEIAFALWKQKPVLPILLERGRMVDYPFLLDDKQIVDATEDSPISAQEIALKLAKRMQIETISSTKGDTVAINHAPLINPTAPDRITDLFHTATELTLTNAGQSIFLYRYLLELAPDFAGGKARQFVKRIEDNLKTRWLKQLEREVDNAIAHQAWTEAQQVIDDMLIIENEEDSPQTHPIIVRLETVLLESKWTKASESMSNDEREIARSIALEMLEIRGDEARALDLIDQLNRIEECDAMYQQAIIASENGRKTALGVLLGHISRICPDFHDTHHLLRHFPIMPEFVWSIHEIMTLDMHRSEIYCLAMSPDETLIASGSADNTIRLWSMPEGQQVAVLRREDGVVRQLSFSRDGQYMISLAGPNVIRIWAMPEGREIIAYESDNGEGNNSLIDFKSNNRIGSITFIPDGRGFVVGFVDGKIKFTEIESGDEFLQIYAHKDWVNALAFSHDGKRLVSGAADPLVRVWDISANQASLISTLIGHAWMVNHVAISPDGKWVASAANEPACKVWDAQTGTLLFNGPHEPNTTVKGVAFSPDGRLVASAGGDSTVRIWDVDNGKLLGSLKGHVRGVNTVIFSPDGTKLISGGTDRQVKIWSMV